MSLLTELKDKREAAGKALASAKELGPKVKDQPDLSEQFNKAHADVIRLLGECKTIERDLQLEAAHAYLNEPVKTTIRHYGMGPLEQQEDIKRYHGEAFRLLIRHGEHAARDYLNQSGVGPTEIHALLSSQGDLGGFMVPEDFRAEVIRELPNFAVFMSIARVVPTSRNVLVFPSITGGGTPAGVYSSGFAGAFKAEGYVTGGTAPTVQNQPKFGQERIPVHSWQPDAIELTRELLEDTAAPLDAILAQIIAETFGLDIDSKGVSGTGVGEPEGIKNAGITTVNTGAAANVAYTGLVDLFTKLPAQYRRRARFMMNSLTYGEIIKLESTGGFPLFPPNSLPGTLFTKPIEFVEFMDDATTASNKPICFGDWSYYVIAERRDMRMQRLVERFAPNVGILPTARVGGQVTKIAAFRLQNVSA